MSAIKLFVTKCQYDSLLTIGKRLLFGKLCTGYIMTQQATFLINFICLDSQLMVFNKKFSMESIIIKFEHNIGRTWFKIIYFILIFLKTVFLAC